MTKTAHWQIVAGAAVLALGLATLPAQAASQIGVAAAVNPDATGHPAGGSARTIVLGGKLTFKERVETSEGGLVQVLLLDGSTFTVGPNSDLVIDEFVYNPDTGKGKLVATFSKGVMRFIGGKLSKNEGGVQVKTPVGLMGIRGGVADVEIANPNSGFFTMIFGEELSLLGPDGQLRKVLEAGYAIDVTGGLSAPIEIRQVTEGEAKQFIAQLSGKEGTSGGAASGPTAQKVQESGVSSQGSDSDPDPNGRGTDAIQSEQASNLHQDTISENTIIARKQMRVLSTGSQYTVALPGGNQTINPTGTGVVGAAPGNPASADQQTEFAINLLLKGKATLQQGAIEIPYPILEGTYIISGVPSPFGTLSGTAIFGPNLDFTFYRLFANGDTTKPIYIIGGNAAPESKLIGTGTQGDVQHYRLGQDIIQQIDMPFVTKASVGTNMTGAYVSDLYLVRPDGVRYDAAPGATDTPVALQASLQIDGSGASQISTLVLGVGATGDAIYRLGGTRQDAEGRVTTFSGGIDLVKGPNGIEFFGPTAKTAIVGPDLDDGLPFIDTPDPVGGLTLDQLVSATIHVATLQSPDDLASLTRTANVFNGFAAGMVEKVGLTDTPQPFRSEYSSDLLLETDPANNTIGGKLTVRDVANLDATLESMSVAFGDGVGGNAGNDGPSAMVDDGIFAAGPNPTATETSVTEDAGPTTTSPSSAATGTYVVSGGLVGNVMPNGRTPTCSSCDFMKWGYWGTKPNFDNATVPVEANVHLGTWTAASKIASEDVANVEIPTTGTATYNGDVFGNVTRTVGTDVQRYTASGDLNMTWDFSTRDGQLNINNFDGLNITSGPGGMTAVNGAGTGSPAEFSGALNDGAGLTGSASGAFALGPLNPGTLPTPQGVIGAFDVNGTVGADAYSAAGSFIGAQ